MVYSLVVSTREWPAVFCASIAEPPASWNFVTSPRRKECIPKPGKSISNSRAAVLSVFRIPESQSGSLLDDRAGGTGWRGIQDAWIRRHTVCGPEYESGRQRRSGRTAEEPPRRNHHSETGLTAATFDVHLSGQRRGDIRRQPERQNERAPPPFRAAEGARRAFRGKIPAGGG